MYLYIATISKLVRFTKFKAKYTVPKGFHSLAQVITISTTDVS